MWNLCFASGGKTAYRFVYVVHVP